jgi:hypothetical protein
MHWLRNFVTTKARRLLRVLLLWFRAMPAGSAIGREEMLLIGGARSAWGVCYGAAPVIQRVSRECLLPGNRADGTTAIALDRFAAITVMRWNLRHS